MSETYMYLDRDTVIIGKLLRWRGCQYDKFTWMDRFYTYGTNLNGEVVKIVNILG